MANTGGIVWLTHLQRSKNTHVATGATKPNVSGDPDYVPNGIDLVRCPVTYSTNCPTDFGYTFVINKLNYEFSIPATVYINPAVSKITVTLLSSGTPTGVPQNFMRNTMTSNFFSGSFTGLSTGTYSIRVNYYDNADALLGINCNL